MRGRFHSIKRDVKKLAEKWREKEPMVAWHLDCAIAEVEKAKERAAQHVQTDPAALNGWP